jgi:hypothetical protein
MSSQWLRHLQSDIADSLEDIRRLFKNPKITLIVRSPDLADGDVVMSDDDLDQAIASLRHLQEKAAHVLPPTGKFADAPCNGSTGNNAG